MNKRNRRRNRGDADSGTPGWMVTFSDLSTLLLTFFVLLLTMSSMDEKTLKSLFSNFTSASGILNFKELGEIYRPKEILIENIYERFQDTMIIKRADDPVEIPAEAMETFLKETGGQVVIQDVEGGFKIVFGHQLMFSLGDAQIIPEMEPILEEVARFIKASSFQVYIGGHTDNLPIRGGPYSDNSSLSLYRAFNIMDYLVNTAGVDSHNIAVGGYGEYHPVAANDTPVGRQQNRRVEIIFKNKTYF